MRTESHKKLHSFRQLIVWQKSMELVTEVYEATKQLPPSEQFGLTSQMRRSAISIPSNIAEGKERSTGKDFRHFLFTAAGSGAELETQLLLTKKIYPNISLGRSLPLLEEVQKMVHSMINHLNTPRASRRS